MITVVNLHNFKVDEEVVKKAVRDTLQKNNYEDLEINVEVAIVNKEEMEELNKTYYKDEKYEHPVFTFPEGLAEVTTKAGDFIFPPGTKKSLGQIVLNYDFVKDLSHRQADQKVYDLISHSTLHLLGVHH